MNTADALLKKMDAVDGKVASQRIEGNQNEDAWM